MKRKKRKGRNGKGERKRKKGKGKKRKEEIKMKKKGRKGKEERKGELIILTRSMWLNYEGRRSTWPSRSHIEGASVSRHTIHGSQRSRC